MAIGVTARRLSARAHSRWPAGACRMSLLSRDDASRTLAVATASRCQGIIALTGPAPLTAGEISQITETVTGRRLRYLALEERAVSALSFAQE